MKCLFCSQEINGTYYYDRADNYVCKKHLDNNDVAYCSECGKLTPTAGYTLPDGRVICRECSQHSLPPETPTTWFREQAAAFLHSIGFDIDVTQVRIYNAASEDMQNYMGCDYSNVDIVGFHAPFSDDKNDIYIRSHLTKTHYTGVLIHEFTHLWQYQNGVYNLPDEVTEGMSQLTSYFFYKAIYGAKSSSFAKYQMDLIESRDDVPYGTGFKKIKEIYNDYGWDGVRLLANKLSEEL